MFPAAPVLSAPVKSTQAAPTQTAQKTTQPQAPETARTSSGESAAANIKAETSKAVKAPEQTAVAPRLRDQETAERTDRTDVPKDAPAGPPPTFKESPLERQARVALEPPDVPAKTGENVEPVVTEEATSDEVAQAETNPVETKAAEPPPTKTERAEASFTETKAMSEPDGSASVDVAI